jgi:hypothetical protein
MTRNILRGAAMAIVATLAAACGGKASDDFKGGGGGSGPTDVPVNGSLAVGTSGSSTGFGVGADGGPTAASLATRVA